MERARVVIIGGGLSSKHAAEILCKKKNLSVTIVQANEFIEWPLAMTYTLVHPDLHWKALGCDTARFQVPGVAYQYGVVKSVDATAKQVVLRSDAVVPYDALIVATGFAMPLIYPALGISLADRVKEVREVGAAIQGAARIMVAGGGPVGIELVGDIRAAYPTKQVTLIHRGGILGQWPEGRRSKVEAQIKEMNIKLLSGCSRAPRDKQLESGAFETDDGKQVEYDVFLPAYSRGPNTQFLEGVEGLLDARGRIRVNEFLQNQAHDSIFAIGTADLDEPAVIPKLEGQWKDAARNVNAFLSGAPLRPHRDAASWMDVPAAVTIGHGPGAFAYLDFDNVPPPVKCCLCGGLGGFPCCPLPCCWPCCGIRPCGFCLGPTDGEHFAKFLGHMQYTSAGFHYKGVGKDRRPGVAAPKQQEMA